MSRDEVLRILAAHRAALEEQAVKRLSIFGRAASDEMEPDDELDIAVEFCKPVGFFGFAALNERLEELLGHAVHLVTEAVRQREYPETATKEALAAGQRLETPHRGHA